MQKSRRKRLIVTVQLERVMMRQGSLMRALRRMRMRKVTGALGSVVRGRSLRKWIVAVGLKNGRR